MKIIQYFVEYTIITCKYTIVFEIKHYRFKHVFFFLLIFKLPTVKQEKNILTLICIVFIYCCISLMYLLKPSYSFFSSLGVYYLSVAAAGFLVFIIVLAVVRLIIFCLVWILTFGKHHIWILPNLTEDVGFFASFWPLYTVSTLSISCIIKKNIYTRCVRTSFHQNIENLLIKKTEFDGCSYRLCVFDLKYYHNSLKT